MKLLVVVAIISVLAAIAVPQYRIYSVKARLASMMQVFDSFVKQVEKYYNIKSSWPTTPGALGYSATFGSSLVCGGGGGFCQIASSNGTFCANGTITQIGFQVFSATVGYGATFPSGNNFANFYARVYVSNNDTVYNVFYCNSEYPNSSWAPSAFQNSCSTTPTCS